MENGKAEVVAIAGAARYSRDMKPIFAILLLVASGSALADCQAAKDDDSRAYCRALETRSKGQCVLIKNSTLRASCSAQLNAGKSGCYTFRDAWQRQKCMDAAKK